MGLVRQSNPAILIEFPERFEVNFPNMSVGVGEVAVISAPEGLGSLLQDTRASGSPAPSWRRPQLRLADSTQSRCRNCRSEVSCLAIVLESVPVEQREDHEACLEELIAVWLALGANEAELLIERHNLGDISHAKGDQANTS